MLKKYNIKPENIEIMEIDNDPDQTWAFIKILTMIREWYGKFSMIKKQGRVQDGKFSKIGRQGRVQDGKFPKIGRDGTRTIILIV